MRGLISAAVTRLRLALRKTVTPEQFAGATDLIKLQACADYADENNVMMVVNDHESHYDLDGGTLLLPRLFAGHVRTDSDARGHLFQNGTVRLQTKSHPDIAGVDASDFIVAGAQKGRVHRVRAETLTLDGFSDAWGVFWVDFADITAGKTILDLSNFAINANTFRNIVSGTAGEYGLDITDGTNAGPTYYECHGNTFIDPDFSRSRGCINRSNLNQTNSIIGGYVEMIDVGYKPISGNWDINGANGDTLGLPAVGLLNHVLGMTTQIERTGGDVLSMPEKSLIALDWSLLDSSGKPPAISGSAGLGVAPDGAMPGGSRARFGGTTSTAFDNITVTVPEFHTQGSAPRFTMAGFWYGDLPAIIEVNNGDGSPASYGAEGFVSLGNGYYLFRLTGYGSIVGPWTIKFFLTTDATEKTGYLGACAISPYKAVQLPYRQIGNGGVVSADIGGMVLKKGSVTQGYVAASPVTINVAYPTPYAAGAAVIPTFSINPVPGYENKMTKCEISPGSITENGFSVDVYFIGDWAGHVYWHALG